MAFGISQSVDTVAVLLVMCTGLLNSCKAGGVSRICQAQTWWNLKTKRRDVGQVKSCQMEWGIKDRLK